MSAVPIVRTVAELRQRVSAWRTAGETVGLVPTMGALHSGHMSLVTLAKSHARRAVVSIFVNPTQFAPHEDFEAYPRDEARDRALLGEVGCDLIFAPPISEMYAPDSSTQIIVGGVSEPLDGAARPQHFSGVATVVAKLLLQCSPDVAVFGEKDYQQLQVIKRLVRDLDIPVKIVGAPTVRLQDGLAQSSRNAYLSGAEREIAGRLNLALAEAAKALRQGETVAHVEAAGIAALERAGFDRIDYFEVRDPDDLARLGPGLVNAPARILTAAVLGKTRLIDNIAV